MVVEKRNGIPVCRVLFADLRIVPPQEFLVLPRCILAFYDDEGWCNVFENAPVFRGVEVIFICTAHAEAKTDGYALVISLSLGGL